MNNEEIESLIDDCLSRDSRLTEWERSFIQSISDQISERALSIKQIDILEKIWERVT